MRLFPTHVTTAVANRDAKVNSSVRLQSTFRQTRALSSEVLGFRCGVLRIIVLQCSSPGYVGLLPTFRQCVRSKQ